MEVWIGMSVSQGQLRTDELAAKSGFSMYILIPKCSEKILFGVYYPRIYQKAKLTTQLISQISELASTILLERGRLDTAGSWEGYNLFGN